MPHHTLHVNAKHLEDGISPLNQPQHGLPLFQAYLGALHSRLHLVQHRHSHGPLSKLGYRVVFLQQRLLQLRHWHAQVHHQHFNRYNRLTTSWILLHQTKFDLTR